MTDKELIHIISKECPSQDWLVLSSLIGKLYHNRGNWSLSPIGSLLRIFKQHGFEQRLLDMLWEHRQLTLKDLRTAATFIQMCGNETWDAAYFETAYALIEDAPFTPNTTAEGDFLSSFGNLSANANAYLLKLKFGKFLELPAGDNIFEDARPYADAIFLHQETSDFLYANSRYPLNSKTEWLAERKTAFFLDHFFSDSSVINAYRKSSMDSARIATLYQRSHLLDGVIQSPDTAAFFDEIKRSGSYLMCTFHAGNYLVSQSIYRAHMADHWTVRNRGNAAGNHIVVSENRLGSAFKAIKVLMSGKCLLIAPDSNVEDSQSVSELNIFGCKVNIPDGAARIAYEAHAKTAWYTATINGSHYEPVFVEGPQRAARESFDSFKTRFAEFYSAQVAFALSGHPRNTILKSFFLKFINLSISANSETDEVENETSDES